MIENLDDLWWGKDFDSYLYFLRAGEFKVKKGFQLLDFLKKLETPKEDILDRELVSRLWKIPLFLEVCKKKMKEELSDNEYSSFKKINQNILREIERILSMP